MQKNQRTLQLLLFIFILLVGFHLSAESPFSSLYGVTLGQTTTAELDKLGEKVTKTYAATGEPYSYYVINGMRFYDDDNEALAAYVSFLKNDPLPSKWTAMDLDWQHSYAEWLALLQNLGLPVRITKYPTYEVKYSSVSNRYNVIFKANLEAFVATTPPLLIRVNFTHSQHLSSVTQHSPGTMWNFAIKYDRETIPFETTLLIPNQEMITLSNRHRAALGLSGILEELNNALHETLNGRVMNEANRKNLLDMLKREWGIETREDLMDMIQSLDEGGHSKAFNELSTLLAESPGISVYEIAEKHELKEYRLRRLMFVRDMRSVVGDRSLRAWDYGAGYILGRMFFGSGRGDSVDLGNTAREACVKLLHTEGGIWRLPWPGGASWIPTTTLQDAVYVPGPSVVAWNRFKEGLTELRGSVLTTAEKKFQEAYDLDSDLYWALLNLGITHKRAGRYNAAIDHLTEYTRKWPEHCRGYIVLGDALDSEGLYREAVEAFSKAIEINDQDPYTFIGRGRAYINLDLYTAALEDLSAAEALYIAQSREDTSYLRYLVGLAYYRSGDYETALPNFLGAYTQYRQNATLNTYIGICYLNKTDPNVDMAVHYFEVAEALGFTLPEEIKRIIRDHEKVSPRSGTS